MNKVPRKIVLPFSDKGQKSNIPVDAQQNGSVSFEEGYTPQYSIDPKLGGLYPQGPTFNEFFNLISEGVRWQQAGGGYTFDSDFAKNSRVGGYPRGARLLRSDALGYWLNTKDNNSTDPTSSGAADSGWLPDFTNGICEINMSDSNYTLNPNEYSKSIIIISGTLYSNVNLIFPNITGKWLVINKTTGNYTIDCKTKDGSGFYLMQGNPCILWCDSKRIYLGVDKSVGYSGFSNIENSLSLNASNAGNLIYCGNPNGPNIDLPKSGTLNLASRIDFVNFGPNSTNIRAFSGDEILLGNRPPVSNVTLNKNDTLQLALDQNVWIAIGGSVQLKYASEEYFNYNAFKNTAEEIKYLKWKSIKSKRDECIYGGIKIDGHYFPTDLKIREQYINWIHANVTFPDDFQWETLDGLFLTISDIKQKNNMDFLKFMVESIGKNDLFIYNVAQNHRIKMEKSKNPEEYDFSYGWPEIYGF